jgi:hypothetical protein
MRNVKKNDWVELTIVGGIFVVLLLGVHGFIASLNLFTRVKSHHIATMGIFELIAAVLLAWLLIRLDASGEFPSLATIRGELKSLITNVTSHIKKF